MAYWVFEIPDDSSVMVKLIEVQPKWRWLSGRLEAPNTLYESGQALIGTGCRLGYNHIIKPTIVGRRQDEGPLDLPDFVGLLIYQKWPGFVEFDEAGREREVTLEGAKRVAAGFVGRGYRGWLQFVSGSISGEYFNEHERCELRLLPNKRVFPWEGPGLVSLEEHSPAIILEWNEEYVRKPVKTLDVAGFCQSLGLRRILPSRVNV